MAEEKKLTRAEQIERFVKANAVTQDKGVTGHARDIGLSLLSGAVSVPETAVGLADLVTGGNAGKTLENQDGIFGFRPKEAKEAIAGWKTERAQKQLQDFQEAEGIGAKFGQALSNPSLVTNTVVESLPAMGAGGVVGRGIGAIAPRLAGVAGGAIGEGTVGAGLSAEQIRQQTEDGLLTPKQAGLAAATGVTTAGFGYAGGKLAQKLGLGDVDTILASGSREVAGNKGVVRRVLEGALTEGLLEELPQSVSEQVLQNEALGKPLDEGVDEAAVLGLLSGGLMGGGAGLASRNASANPDTGTDTNGGPTTGPTLGLPPPDAPSGNGGTPRGLDDINRDWFGQGRGPDSRGMRDVTPQNDLGPGGNQLPINQPRLPYNDGSLASAADMSTATDTGAPQLGFYGERKAAPTPAEDMGIDASKGGLSAAAALAVNSGVSAPIDNAASNANTTTSNENTRSAADKRAGELRANAPYKMDQAKAIADNEAYGQDYLARQQASQSTEPAAPTKVDAQPEDERLTANSQIATGKDGKAKWFGREEKAQEFIAKKNISDTHEVVSAGKSRFEIQPKAQTTEATQTTEAKPLVSDNTEASLGGKPVRATPVKDETKSTGRSFTADNDEVPYQWDVVDAKDLVSSHTNTFGENPDFPKNAQPRDRANANYQAQVLKIQKEFNPELLGESSLVSDGSPFVGANDNVVESGNGRTIAIRRTYESGNGEAYRQFVQDRAEKFGLDPETVASMNEPVLVRRNLSTIDRSEFAVKANKDNKAAMGSTERARIDAQAMPNTDLIEFDSNGSMNLGKSRKFTQAFTSALGTNEAGNLVADNGEISQSGKARIAGALIHNAYESDKLTRAVTETVDPSAKNVLNTLADKAPQISKLKQQIKDGKGTDTTLAKDISAAAEKYIDLVETGANIDMYLGNNNLFNEDAVSPQVADIIGDFYDNSRSGVKMGAAIQARIDAATNAGKTDLLGEVAPAAPVNNKKRSILRNKNKPQEVSANEKSETAANIQTDPTGNAQEQANSDATANANGEPAENKPPKTLGAGKDKRTLIGNNADGKPVYEDKNGIRSIRKGAFMASEPVKIQLGNDEDPYNTSNRPDEYKLDSEQSPTEQVIEDAEVIEDTPASTETVQPKTAKTKKEKERFSNNSFTNKEEAERRIARIKSKMGTLNSGMDPEMMGDGIYVAVAFIEDGILAFKDFAKAMTETLGNDITPYLSMFWEGARRYPGFEGSDGMTSMSESDAQFKQLMLEYKPSKDMEAVLGEDKTQVKPKRKVTKPTNKDVMLRQDWGVKTLDGYAESDEFTGEQTDYGVSGGVKDAFLKDSKAYLTATKKHLESLGYTMALDRKGKPMKVNVNESGPATSGEVSLSMHKDGSNIHVSIGQSSVPMLSMFRDMNADGTPVDNKPHPQQVAVMYRTSMNDGDTYATKQNNSSGNIWLSHKLTATELAQDIDKTSNAIAARANLKKSNYGVADIDKRDDADEILAFLTDTETKGAATNDDSAGRTSDQAGATALREPGRNAQSRNAQDDTGNVEARQSEDDSTPTEAGNTRRSIVRGSGANVADNGAVPSQRNATNGRQGTSGTGTPTTGTGERTGTDSGALSPAATSVGAADLLISNPLEIVGGTPVQRFNKNREALELLQTLETEGRQATPAEQRTLAGYIGWGSFGQELFQGSWDHPKYQNESTWKERGEWLRETMGESAWKSAQRSITNAHYTDPPTVMAMWSMVERMGFDGGRVLEPSMGTGNFFSMMPPNVQARSQLTGIELDEMTGAIAKQLFPKSNIQVMGYQDSKTPDDFYDVVIGNYPFENTPVADRRYNKLNPMLHDYFFLKSMDQVRPGGIVISITSTGTMDKQNTGIRRELAKQADLVAAIRLPSGAFKDYAGTAVVTDIVILRKRQEKLAMVPEDATWVNVADYKTPSGETIKLSQYYIDNPQNVIGTLDYESGGTRFGGMTVKRPNNMEQRLKDAINLVPENAIQPANVTDHLTYYANATGERHGSLFANEDGELMLARGDQMVKAQDLVKYEVKSKKTTDERESQIKAAIDLRRKLSALIDNERAAKEAETERKALKAAYNAFVKDYGSIRESYALKYMQRTGDPFYFELAALELDDGKPAAIMNKSTTRGMVTMENPSVRDAYVLARNKSINPTLKEIAELTGKPESEISKELKDTGAVFEAPNGDIVPSDIYLSGNVRQKLREAQAALKDGNKAMTDNVAALEAVVPTDVPYFNIETKLGATWIPSEAYQDFIAHMLGKSSTDGIKVSFLSGRWKVKLDKGMNNTAEARTNYGTSHYSFSALVQAAFSNQVVRVTKRVDGEDVYDTEASSEANQRIAKMREDFGGWLWGDAERRIDLEKEYNEARNAWATPKYDGSFLTFEGMALTLGRGEFNLREHQANAIWRAIVNRRSINAHEVGTGKTFTMGGIAIESRRYGIAKKPVIFAHNANSAAVAEEIRMMYPSARVLYVNNLEPKVRDVRLRQIANDDWDAVVLPHSLLDRMTLTEDSLMAMAADDIAALEQEFREAMEDDGENASRINLDDDDSISKIRSTTAKELAKSRKRIIETIRKQAQQSSREGAVTFEDLGIDMILVDEVHEFKKPPIVTRMKMKGLNTQTSQRSIQLQFLTKYVRQMNNGGNVHTFTGTPITNTITEIYHQMRYVMDTEMQEAAVSDWDGWFGSFATEVQDVELTSAGDYEMVTRLAGFVNVPELRQMIGQYMDTVFAEDMPEMQPRKTKSGKTMSDDLTEDERAQLLNGRTENAKDRPYKKVINESADMTEAQKSIFAKVQGYAREWRDAAAKQRKEWQLKGDHRTPLAYGRLADTASFDARLLDPSLVGQEGQAIDDPNSKTSRVVKNAKEIYDSHDLANQVIFMDSGYGTKAKRSGGRNADGEKNPDITVDIFSPVLDLVERLVQSGIPREQIAVVSGSTNKDKRALIAKGMNDGSIRIVIGSTQTLGVGVNMQRNLRAMHHMDAPYMPGELEQRNGRGQRQGNQWNTVLEYRYMTDRLDGKRWQILAVKQRFITAFMKASGDTRTIEGDAVEESNDILESFSEAAGDPRILQRVKLQKKQDQLNNKERLYTRGIADMRKEIRRQGELIARNQATLDEIKPKVVADALEKQRENFSVVIGGKTYDKRADATEALNQYIKDNVRLGDKEMTQVGTYAGAPLYAGYKMGSTEVELSLKLGGRRFDGKGINGLEAVMRNLPKQMDRGAESIEQSKATIENLNKAVTQPFTQKAELERVSKQITDLEADLDLNPIPAPLWLRQGAPMDSEVFYGKKPFIVTGHQYGKEGYFVVAEDSKGAVLIPYLEAKDGAGMTLYDEQEFVAPEVVTKKDDELTEADRVPGNDDKQFSRTGPVKGNTTTTAKQVMDKLYAKFGKAAIDKLIANGTLEIKTLNDYVVDGRLTIPDDVDGIYHNGTAILIADNLSDDMIIPTFLHELGGHGGMQTLMDKKAYDALMRDFDALVKAGDPMAVQAKAMADSVARNKQDALDEYLPYLVTLAARANAKQGKVAGMINRMVMAIRSWLKNTLGISMKMNAQDVLALAERMVEARTQPPLNNIQSPINSFEGVNAPQEEIAAVRKDQAKTLRQAPNGKPSKLNDQQWLQVRTPAFKQWFGDWENDPANASKILDENGEPLVLYHGTKSDFWVFDMSRSVPQRNEGMMGMFFTENAKTAAGYTVDLRKEAAVVKAKEDHAQANIEFSFKRRQLESEDRTGDEIQDLTKKEFEAMKAAEVEFKAAVADAFNNAYDNAESRTKAVFVKSQMPFEQDAEGKSFLGVNKKAAERYFVDGIYDGIVNNNVLDDANAYHSVGAAKVVISFNAANIKSATDNTGAFDSANDDIRYSKTNGDMKFSRSAGAFDPQTIAKESVTRFHDWVSSTPPGKLSWWHKTIGTMYNLSQRNKFFKPVFDHTEKFINDVSYFASKASEFAPRLLPKLDSLKDITKTAIGAKDNDAISKPIFEGTLLWGRDLNGKAVLIDDWRKKVMATSIQDRLQLLKNAGRITPAQEAELATLKGIRAQRFINGIIDDEVSAGLVWTDNELRSKFNLNDDQVALYREFRSATNNSLDSLTRSDMLRKLGKEANDIEKQVMDAGTLDAALSVIEQHINNLSTAEPKKAQALAGTLADIKASAGRTKNLMGKGYAPLSRFGQYTVDVVDANGDREYFGMFESAYDARKMAEKMGDLYGTDFVTQGALSAEEFKMFAGVTPETAELFGEMLGLDATGDKAADQAFQEFLKRTKNNRSAMKRLMHRKGIKGYSEDVGRVLASFIYSNARHTSAALNMGNLDRSIADIPKAEGQLKDAAVKLAQYIKNPQEEGSVIRGWMFAQYLGGSIASAVVNLTQPIAVSFPYLSQFGGAAKAAAELARSSSDWATKKAFSADLQKAIEDAEADGTLSPQEVHNLLRQARGQNPLRAGDGTKYGDAKAALQNTGSRVGLGWGAFFSLAEQINRRVTFVAAYRMAQDQGMADPAKFASQSIKETQFVYNKASRMQWGRGAVGGTLLTFKTYSVSYIELMHRMWTQGEKGSPERAAGRKASLIMLATLFMLAGGGGLPFMEDLEDVIDGMSQIMGYNLSSRKARQEFLDSVFGEMLGEFVETGITGIPGMPTDISGRLGMDNLIPGTGVFKQRTSNTKDVLELLGPGGDFVSRVGTGSRSILKGAVSGDARQVGRGALELAPVAVRNAIKGTEMATTGIYKDTKGYKVSDVTPIDAAFKAIGFQPKDISKIQGAAWLSQSNTAYYNLRASEIRALWAQGISEGNKSKVKDAQAALATWNAKNPSQKIVIRPTDIQRRIREMNMDKSDRVTKLAPKSMREQIQADFANAQGD